MGVSKLDENSRASLTALTDDSNLTITPLVVDASTKRLKVSAIITSGAITSLNGQTGSTQTFADVDDTNVTLTISSASNVHTFTMGWQSTLAVARGGTGAGSLTGLLLGNGTSAFTAITTSAGIAGAISDETGSGSLVFANTPTLVTPVLGAATATSINGLTISSTTGTLTLANGSTLATSGANSITLTSSGATNVTLPTTGTLATLAGSEALTNKTVNGLTITSSTGTLTITDGKVLSATNTITLSGTDSTVMTFPTTSASIARTDAGQTFTGVQVMTSPTITTSLTTGSTTFGLLSDTATTINFAGASGAVINLGGGANAAELRFLEPSGSGTNYTALKAQAQGANITYTLPATVASAGQVLTDAAGNGTLSWATPSASSSTSLTASTCFESTTRFTTATGGTGNGAFGVYGASCNTGATSGSYVKHQWRVIGETTGLIYKGSPTFTCRFQTDNLPATNAPEFYCGIGEVTVSGTGHTFTENHAGVKIKRVSGSWDLIATSGDGTAEETTNLTTGLGDTSANCIEVNVVITSDTNVKFYWRNNGGAWSSATTHSTRVPASSASDRDCQFSSSNVSTTGSLSISIQNATYTR